jgi:hypothetical protein
MIEERRNQETVSFAETKRKALGKERKKGHHKYIRYNSANKNLKRTGGDKTLTRYQGNQNRVARPAAVAGR